MIKLSKTRYLFQNLLLVITGSLLYGGLNKILSSFVLPGADFITFRPQLVIPVMSGLLFGPWIGGFVGLFGNFFGDQLIGFGTTFLHWCFANFLIGFIPGIVRWIKIKEIKQVTSFGLVLLFIFLGNAAGLFLGFMVQILLDQGSFQEVMYSFYLPALISNTYILLLLIPSFLAFFKFLKLNIETRSMFFVLLFSLIVITILSLVFVKIQYNTFSEIFTEEEIKFVFQEMILNDFRWVGIVLLAIVSVSGLIGYYFSKKYMHPINQLAEASNKLKNAQWSDNEKIDAEQAGEDMKNLIGIFNDMAHEIQKREARMNIEINELRLQIDKKKEDKLFSEITETDFFKKLEKKSQEIREKRTNKTGN